MKKIIIIFIVITLLGCSNKDKNSIDIAENIVEIFNDNLTEMDEFYKEDYNEYKVNINDDRKIDTLLSVEKIKNEVDGYLVEEHILLLKDVERNIEGFETEIDVFMSFPQLQCSNKKLEDRINNELVNYISYGISVEEMVDYYYDFIEKEPVGFLYDRSGFEITYMDDEYLSMKIDTKSIYGGANANKSFNGVTIDMQNLKILQLDDIGVTKEYIIDLIESEKYYIVGEITGISDSSYKDFLVREELTRGDGRVGTKAGKTKKKN